MRHHRSVETHAPELDLDIKEVEDTGGVLETLPSLPNNRDAVATGVGPYVVAETETLHSTHARNVLAESTSDPIVISHSPAAPVPTKKRNIHVVAAFSSLGGFLFGSDTGSIGPITSMPQFIEVFPSLKSEAMLGAFVATILMSATLASFASGWLSDKYSRKYTIMMGAYIFGLGAAIEAGSGTLPMLITGRLIVGVGEGIFLSAIGVYLVEISPPDVRGGVSCMLQLLIAIGITVGYFVCYFSLEIKSSLSWRTPFLVQTGVAVILGTGMPWMPYSPRWLFQNGRVEEAWRVLEGFDRHSSSEKEKEELLAKAAERQGRDETIGVVQAFKDPDSRGRTLLAIFLMGMQQMSGIDAVLFYGPILFTQAGLTSRQASFLASGVCGILEIVCAIPAQLYLLDKWGRRSSAIVGGFITSGCMLAIGALYAAEAQNGPGRYAIIAFIYLFVTAFSTTWAVSFKVFIAEIQPMRVRATATSLAHSSNWLCNLVVALTTPIFLSRSVWGPYFMFGMCLLLTAVVCMIWMPETLGKSLQEIDGVWEMRMKRSQEILHNLVTMGVGKRRRGEADEVELQERRVDV